MSLHRRAARRDETEQSIVDALRQCGWSVLRISDKGAPDLLAARGAHLVLIEVKSKSGKFTKDQQVFMAAWAGQRPLVFRTVDDALDFHRALFVDDPYRKG